MQRHCLPISRCTDTTFTPLEYKDDSHIIPRSSSVIARRVPASRPGKGKIPMYVAGGGAPTSSMGPPSNNSGSMPMGGRGAMSMRFDRKEETVSKPQESSVRVLMYRCDEVTQYLLSNRPQPQRRPPQFQTRMQLWQRCSKRRMKTGRRLRRKWPSMLSGPVSIPLSRLNQFIDRSRYIRIEVAAAERHSRVVCHTNSLKDLSLPATCAIGVARKVNLVRFSIWSLP